MGAQLDLDAWTHLPLRALLFGEAQGRAVVSTAAPDAVVAIATSYGVPATVIGTVCGASEGFSFTAGQYSARVDMDTLATAFHEAIPQIMSQAGTAAHSSN
jgi:phosphoribosylformylglycinamidine synthase